MKSIEEMQPQELLRLMVRQNQEMTETLKSIRRHLIVIAIPFWISLIVLVVGIGLWVLVGMAVAL